MSSLLPHTKRCLENMKLRGNTRKIFTRDKCLLPFGLGVHQDYLMQREVCVGFSLPQSPSIGTMSHGAVHLYPRYRFLIVFLPCVMKCRRLLLSLGAMLYSEPIIRSFVFFFYLSIHLCMYVSINHLFIHLSSIFIIISFLTYISLL